MSSLLSRIHPRSFALPLLLLVGAVTPGCGFFIDEFIPRGPSLECTAQVRSADGHVETISSLTHPDFVEIVTSGGTTETAQLREYFLCEAGSCPAPDACPRFSSIANAEADWESWLGLRVRGQTAEPTSVFGQFEGPWCLVPDTIVCTEAAFQEGYGDCGLLPSVDRLPICPDAPPPPPGDPCLEIACSGGVPCTSVDFGDLPLGGTATETVTVSNCGATASPDIALVLDGEILPDLAFGQRDFAVTRNDCLPDTPEEMLAGEEILTNPLVDAVNSRCEFDVTFAPENPREHGAEIAFRSDLDPRHQIVLRGNGLGGSLIFEVPDLPDPRAIPPAICVDAVVGSCTRSRIVRITNTGPGAVTITDVRLDRGAPNWQVVMPTGAALPVTLGPADPPFDVTVRWCTSAPPEELDGQLVIDTNSPDTPTFLLGLNRQGSGTCPPGT